MDKKQISVRIPMDLWERFRIALIKNNTSAQAVLLQAVEEYINKEEEEKC